MLNNRNPESLFEDFHPLKPNSKKVKRLERKINGSRSTINTPIFRIGGAIALLFLFLGTVTLYFSDLGYPAFPMSGQQDIETADVTERHYVFSGKGENWEAKVVSDSIQLWHESSDKTETILLEGSGNNDFYLTYKGEDAQSFMDFRYEIEGTRFGNKVDDPGAFYEGNTLHKKLNDAVLYKKEKLTLKVNWDGHEETLTLDFDKDASSEETYERAMNLSNVEINAGKDTFLSSWNTFGSTGGDEFQVSSVGWDDRMTLLKHFEPSLSATGKHLSQSVLFTFSDKELFTSDLKIVGKHSNGTEKTLWKGDFNSPYLSEFDGRYTIPAVVNFGKPGYWTLTAYDKNKKIGTVSIDVRRRNVENLYNGILKDDILWSMKFGMLSSLEKSNDEIPVLTTGDDYVQKVMWLFRHISGSPVVIIGMHESGTESFVETLDSLDSAMHGADYSFVSGPRFPKEGTWNVKAFANGEYIGEITFKVDHGQYK